MIVLPDEIMFERHGEDMPVLVPYVDGMLCRRQQVDTLAEVLNDPEVKGAIMARLADMADEANARETV